MPAPTIKIKSASGGKFDYFYQGPRPGQWDEIPGLPAQEVFRKVAAILKMYPKAVVVLPKYTLGPRTTAVPTGETPFVVYTEPHGQEVMGGYSTKELWDDYGKQFLRGVRNIKPPASGRPAPGWEDVDHGLPALDEAKLSNKEMGVLLKGMGFKWDSRGKKWKKSGVRKADLSNTMKPAFARAMAGGFTRETKRVGAGGMIIVSFLKPGEDLSYVTWAAREGKGGWEVTVAERNKGQAVKESVAALGDLLEDLRGPELTEGVKKVYGIETDDMEVHALLREGETAVKAAKTALNNLYQFAANQRGAFSNHYDFMYKSASYGDKARLKAQVQQAKDAKQKAEQALKYLHRKFGR